MTEASEDAAVATNATEAKNLPNEAVSKTNGIQTTANASSTPVEASDSDEKDQENNSVSQDTTVSVQLPHQEDSVASSESATGMKRRSYRSRRPKIDDPFPWGLHITDCYQCQLQRDPKQPALGMKLCVAPTGQIIVQNVQGLPDGRASPAQCSGKIRRGDILVKIDGISLRHQAILGLDRLKDTRIQAYTLLLAPGAGHGFLREIEKQPKRTSTADPAVEMLGLFPMVDQLSGMPIFDVETAVEAAPTAATTTSSQMLTPRTRPTAKLYSKTATEPTNFNDTISDNIAHARAADRDTFLSDVYRNQWQGTKIGDILERIQNQVDNHLTYRQRQELGHQALRGAYTLVSQVERQDAGIDVRSFQSWKTTLSLYSRASTRRRRVLDAASLPASFARVDEQDGDDDDSDAACASQASGNSDDGSEQVDGDELLLRLAAHDEIWRKQVIEFLENVGKEPVEGSNGSNGTHPPQVPPDTPSKDLDAAISSELGNFLFGENMTKILAKHHKSPRALPSEEITAVLFDLATRLSASVPDEIKASGSLISSRTGLTPFGARKRQVEGSDFDLAMKFLLREALPAWLKSFKPLAWEHRRILWPVDRQRRPGSTAASTISDDSLTLDSASLQSTTTSRQRKRKNYREIIEDNELNPETRGETCFLATFFFIHALLPSLMDRDPEPPVNGTESLTGETDMPVVDIEAFLKNYGSYVKMDTCVAYASVLKAESVLKSLLGIAKHDPRHREVIKQTSKSASMVFYEPTMLSAVLQLLNGIEESKTMDRKHAIIDLCVSAYPDLRPWQVAKTCNTTGPSTSNLYYRYLSLLLHPTEGHELARRDRDLVEEWCRRSVDGVLHNESEESRCLFQKNLFSVASRTSSYHLVYHRNLPELLKMSMEIDEFELALDLAGEIVDQPEARTEEKVLVRDELRRIGDSCVGSSLTGMSKVNANRMLRRILRLYSKESFRGEFNVHDEVHRLVSVVVNEQKTEDVTSDPQTLEIVQFLGDEANPGDVLTAIGRTASNPLHQPEMIPLLHTILSRGASSATELSSSLLRIQQARQERTDLPMVRSVGQLSEDSECSAKQSVWKSMSIGMVSLEK